MRWRQVVIAAVVMLVSVILRGGDASFAQNRHGCTDVQCLGNPKITEQCIGQRYDPLTGFCIKDSGVCQAPNETCTGWGSCYPVVGPPNCVQNCTSATCTPGVDCWKACDDSACTGGPTPTPAPTGGTGNGGCDAACSTNADCASGLTCDSRGTNNDGTTRYVCWGNACEQPGPNQVTITNTNPLCTGSTQNIIIKNTGGGSCTLRVRLYSPNTNGASCRLDEPYNGTNCTMVREWWHDLHSNNCDSFNEIDSWNVGSNYGGWMTWVQRKRDNDGDGNYTDNDFDKNFGPGLGFTVDNCGPSCTVSIPVNTTVQIGTPVDVTATTTGTVEEVRFTSGAPAYFTATSPVTSSPYTSNITGVKAGTKILTADGVVDGAVLCTKNGLITVKSPTTAWWQVEGGATAMQNIVSNIPSGSSSKNLDNAASNSTTGVIATNGTITKGSGGISIPKWKVENPPIPLSTTIWDNNGFDVIKARILINVTPDAIGSTVNSASDLTTGTAQPDGTYYVTANSFTISGDIDLVNKKVVMITEGNVNINKNVNLNDNNGFLMILAGENITVDPSVGTLGDPSSHAVNLEGLFITNGIFDTGPNTTNKTLRVEGVVAAGGGVSFGRTPSVTTYPGEYFKFRPDLVSLIPIDVLGRSSKWQELAP